MEDFFYEDRFCYDISCLMDVLDIDEENLSELPDNWEVKIELSNVEPIFKLDVDTLFEMIMNANEHRLGEDFDEEEKIKNALKESIDFDKLRTLLPKFCYPSGRYETITKLDL